VRPRRFARSVAQERAVGSRSRRSRLPCKSERRRHGWTPACRGRRGCPQSRADV